MEDKNPSEGNLSVNAITSLSNVTEIREKQSNHSHLLILFIMVIFVFLIVGLSVYNFNGLIPQQDAQIIHYIKNNAPLNK